MSKNTETSLPVLLIVGTLENVSRKDAEIYVRGLMGRLCGSLEASGFYLEKTANGYHYEIQEGGEGKAWLPWILKALAEENNPLFFRVTDRIVEIRIHDDRIQGILKVEHEVEEEVLSQIKTPVPGKALIPFKTYAERWIITSGVIFVICLIFFATALGLKLVSNDQEYQRIRIKTAIKISNLPLLHWPENVAEDSYVKKMSYENGNWKLQLQKYANQETEVDPATQPGPGIAPIIKMAPASR